MICSWYEAPIYLFFAPDLPELLYYSHLPAIITALIVGLFVFLNNRESLLNRVLFLIALSFTGWALINLISWTNVDTRILLFTWTFFGVLQALISILSIYFIYVFLTNRPPTIYTKLILLILILPVLLLATTNINVGGFNLDNCDAFDYEGVAFLTYYSFLGVIAILWIAILLISHFRKATIKKRKQIILMGIGIESFLFLFFAMVYLGSIGTIADYYENSNMEFYGMFGMTFFMVMMGILIVRFKTFNVGAHASQALVVALLVLVASQFTYVKTTTSIILTSVTLILTAIAGLIIVRSVKKEIAQREEIEKLAEKLRRANKRLRKLDQMKSEFVSIASHQLRSPLTSIRGYASMLLEGSYGKLNQKAREAIQRIADSSQYMATSVEDYLNVSRIESGNMKYEMMDFNLKEEAEHVADDKRQEAVKKGLLLTFKSDLDTHGIVNADIGKTRQILHNLVNNALKYTPRGTVTVFVHDDKKKKKIYVDVIDSGIGMKKEELEDIFGKFERAHNANQTNVTGTGLGLFVARKMARAMGGEITAYSDGVGHGSTFRLEMPLQM